MVQSDDRYVTVRDGDGVRGTADVRQEEVLVVRRQLMLREEVHIKKKQVEHKHRETVRLRRENVNVKRRSMEDDEQA